MKFLLTKGALMKKISVVSTIILTVIIVTAFATNPSKSEYVSWLKDRELNQSTNIVEYYAISALGNSVLSTTTEQSNYLLFSVFKTKLGNDELKIIGLFNKFIPLNYNEFKNLNSETEV